MRHPSLQGNRCYKPRVESAWAWMTCHRRKQGHGLCRERLEPSQAKAGTLAMVTISNKILPTITFPFSSCVHETSNCQQAAQPGMSFLSVELDGLSAGSGGHCLCQCNKDLRT